jgi:hypothetical protein
VLPDDSDAFDTPIAVHLLARAAQNEGVRLAIVSRRRLVRYWAAAEGIPFVGRVSQLPREAEGPTFGLSTLLTGLMRDVVALVARVSAWVVALLIIFVLGVLALALVPRAVVVVRPVSEDLTSNVQIVVSLDSTAPDPAKGIVPGRQVYLLVDSVGSVPVTRPDHPSDGHAVGWLTFENRTPDAQVIPRGTDVSTYGGAHFLVTQAATLAARPGSTVTLPIRAVSPGSGANVRRGEIIVVSGPLHWLVVAVNEEPTSGGGSAGESIVTAWDTHAIVQQVATAIHGQAHRELAAQLGPGETTIPETVELSPIEETFSHQLGDVSPDLGLDAQFRASAMIYNQDQFRSLALQLWHPSIRPDYALLTGSVDVGAGQVSSMTPDAVTFNVPIRAIAYKVVNVDRIAALARLRSAPTIEAELAKEYDLAAPPRVAFTPAWARRALRVNVVVDTSPPSSATSPLPQASRGSA